MYTPFSHLYNAVILPITSPNGPGVPLFQVSASRNDREAARYLSPAWTERELESAFVGIGVSTLEFQELLRGNQRATGGRNARRLLFTLNQMESMGLAPEVSEGEAKLD